MAAPGPSVVVVAGGTGNIGEGIIRSALRAGVTVVVPSRSARRLDALREHVEEAGVDPGSLTTVEADIGSFDGAQRFVAETRAALGRIDLSVASLGGWWAGPPLLETSEADWRRVMGDNLDAHYVFARHVVPALDGGGIHVLIGGPGNLLANPRSTLITIAGHAQLAMSQLLDREAGASGARCYQLFVAQILDRQRGGGAGGDWSPRPGVIVPDQIGDRILQLYTDRPDAGTQTLFAAPVPGFPL